jgi:hypothetical protein
VQELLRSTWARSSPRRLGGGGSPPALLIQYTPECPPAFIPLTNNSRYAVCHTATHRPEWHFFARANKGHDHCCVTTTNTALEDRVMEGGESLTVAGPLGSPGSIAL